MLAILRLFVELLTSLVIAGYVLAALWALLRGQDLVRARLLVADGILTALSLKLIATLLRTVELSSWEQIGMFVAVLALRTFLKWVITWEQRQLQETSP
jgi:uncharacterized membrane protein